MKPNSARVLGTTSLGIGLACAAAYLNVHGESAMFLWFGLECFSVLWL